MNRVSFRQRLAALGLLTLLILLILLTLPTCWKSPNYPPLSQHRVDASSHDPHFPIGPSTRHRGIECPACHGGTSTFLDFDCLSCHDHNAAHTDSLHRGVDGYFYVSRACFECHPRADSGGVSHTLFFPIGGGTRHEGLHCGDCHPDPNTRKIFTCTSCHTHRQSRTDSTHVQVANYVFDSPACLACHPGGEVLSREAHASFFPIAVGVHDTTACSGCHPVPGGYQNFTCISCHAHSAALMNPGHSAVAGYQFDSPSCRACHPQGAIMTRAQHLSLFPIDSGRHNLPCQDCHTTPLDYRKFECILCHEHSCANTNPQHREVGGYTCVSSECYRCHPRGSGGG